MQVGPALTSGYIVVVKASELNALKLALQAGVPPVSYEFRHEPYIPPGSLV